MSRRRPSFRAYVRRRWRALGLLIVLLAGSLLVLAVTDRGHDPLWEARGGVIDQATLSPDGDVAYVLVGEKGNISGLQAQSGVDGALLWESPMNATRALLRSTEGGVVVATGFPLALLTFYADDGSAPRYQIAPDGNPSTMAVEGGRVALALQKAGNPVLLLDGGRVLREHRFGSVVSALDMRAGRIAVGTNEGEVAVYSANGTTITNVSLGFNVKSLRLSADGAMLVAGGYSLQPGDLGGRVAFLDAGGAAPVRWTRTTGAGVGLVDLDKAGVVAIAVEESAPRHVLHVYDGGAGGERWSRQLPGLVARDDAGALGGAALAPDGRYVVVATLRGGVEAFVSATGKPAWSYASAGTTVVTFAREKPGLVAANAALAPNGPADSLLLFSAEAEPTIGKLGAMAAVVFALAALAAAVVLGVGYWRVRRSY